MSKQNHRCGLSPERGNTVRIQVVAVVADGLPSGVCMTCMADRSPPMSQAEQVWEAMARPAPCSGVNLNIRVGFLLFFESEKSPWHFSIKPLLGDNSPVIQGGIQTLEMFSVKRGDEIHTQ